MKKPIQSKTIWFSSLSLLAVIGTTVLADENLKGLLGDNVGLLVGFVAFVNIGLRLITDKAIGYDNNNAVEDALGDDSEEYGV